MFTFFKCRTSISSMFSKISLVVSNHLAIVSQSQVGSLLMGTCMQWICAIFSAIIQLKVGSANSLVSNGLAGIYSSIRPPGNIPCNLGPSRLSDNNVKITDSVINPSKALSPCIWPYNRNKTCRGSPRIGTVSSGNWTLYNQLLNPPLKKKILKNIQFNLYIFFLKKFP